MWGVARDSTSTIQVTNGEKGRQGWTPNRSCYLTRPLLACYPFSMHACSE